jgi:carboxypeptidase C (cathepsin A)
MKTRRLRRLSRIVAGAAVGSCLVSRAGAQIESLSTTKHQVQVAGRVLQYTAYVGRIPIKDTETGEPHGYMGFIAYRVPTTGAPRPLTFLWNGGPGSNSALLHFEAVGPKRLSEGRLIDNAETVLTHTDLVFVDPIGTGFSRPTKREYASEFYQTNGDVRSVTEFVRAWRLLFDATDAPLFLGGESWGSGRAAAVGYALEKMGVRVNGLILISGGTGLRGGVPRELSTALRIVQLAPIALYHSRLSPVLGRDTGAIKAQARTWARETYAPALARIESLTNDEREEIAKKLALYSGLPVDQIDRRTLVITPRQHLTGLLGDQKKTLNTFDMRIAGADASESASRGIINNYLRRELEYRTDLAYIGLDGGFEVGFSPSGAPSRGVGSRWDYFSGTLSPDSAAVLTRIAAQRGGGPPGGQSEPGTELAMGLDPKLRAHVANGLFDSLANCEATAETMQRLEPAIRARVTFRCYGGGHMMYRDPDARRQLSADIKALVSAAR